MLEVVGAGGTDGEVVGDVAGAVLAGLFAETLLDETVGGFGEGEDGVGGFVAVFELVKEGFGGGAAFGGSGAESFKEEKVVEGAGAAGEVVGAAEGAGELCAAGFVEEGVGGQIGPEKIEGVGEVRFELRILGEALGL